MRGPNKRLLRPDGEDVPEITFWHRRVRDGDVVLAEPPAPPPGPPPVVRGVSGQLQPVAGEKLRLTAAEWARLPVIEPPSGPAVEGFAIAAAEHERDPAARLLTHDEYLAEIKP